jgi:hypothetical protein
MILAVAVRASAVEATLVADAHVNIACDVKRRFSAIKI